MNMNRYTLSLLTIGLFFSMGIGTPVSLASIEQSAELYHQEASRAFQENRLDDAEALLKQAVDLDPKNYEYHFELSHIYAARFDHTQKSTDPLARISYEQALAELQKTRTLKPDFVPAHFNLGVLFKNLGRYEEAREEFREVLRLKPDETQAYFQIGETYERQGFYDDARDTYRKVKAMNLQDNSADEAIQMSYQNEKQYDAERKGRDLSNQLMHMNQPILRAGSDAVPSNTGNGNSSMGSSLTQAAAVLAQSLLAGRGSNQDPSQ